MSLRSISTKARSAFAALVCFLVAAGLGLSSAAQSPIERLVSPGKLSNAHAKFEAECSNCHVSFNKGAQTAKCLDCHDEIAADVRSKRGFHGRSPNTGGADCKSCHAEHEGRGADIVKFDRKAFNHTFTDFQLRGAHQKVECAECHSEGKKFSTAATDCIGCHEADDPHLGRLGTDCASCHAASEWVAISFDHATTRFSLIGVHARQECAACHVNQAWKTLTSDCVSCHAKDDVHKGGLGEDCASCHTAQGWKVSGFDHAKTGFPLVGRHGQIDCQACHKGSVTAALPNTCNGCHARDDVHKGGNGTKCADCHTPASWAVVRFDHSKTKFPLVGKHASTKCETCHTKPIAAWKPPRGCLGCHNDDDKHKGLLGPACQNCHSETSWARIRFDHARDADFALRGKHGAATCAACHLVPVTAKSPPTGCIGCHKTDDPHKGQLGDGCGRCHGETSWKASVRFDHGLTDFPLLGKHEGADCKDCHTTPAFLDASVECSSCHAKEDKHRGRLGPNCATCHNPADWRRWKFDHSTQTSYPLTGQHKDQACESCHRERVRNEIKISTRCVSCHIADDKHDGSFGSSCERCHTTEGFWAVSVAK
jgi:hypothetical protein